MIVKNEVNGEWSMVDPVPGNRCPVTSVSIRLRRFYPL